MRSIIALLTRREIHRGPIKNVRNVDAVSLIKKEKANSWQK